MSKKYFDCNVQLANTINQLEDEYAEDCKVTYATLGDKVMQIPQIKQKWISRLQFYRRELSEAKAMREDEFNNVVKEIKKNSKVEMSTASAAKAISSGNYPRLAAIEERVALYEEILQAIDDIVNKHIRYINEEIRCMVDMTKLENM